MANHKSAKKRAKQDAVRRLRNRSYIGSVRTAAKKFAQALVDLDAGKIEAAGAEKEFKATQAQIAKAAAKGLIHRNNASRRISRMSQALAKRCAPKS